MEKSGAPSAHRKGKGEEKEHMRLVSMLLKRKFNEFFQLFLFFPHFHRHFHFYREFDFILSQCTKTVSRSNGLRDFLHVRLKENQHQRSTVPFFCSTKEQNIATQEWKSRKWTQAKRTCSHVHVEHTFIHESVNWSYFRLIQFNSMRSHKSYRSVCIHMVLSYINGMNGCPFESSCTHVSSHFCLFRIISHVSNKMKWVREADTCNTDAHREIQINEWKIIESYAYRSFQIHRSDNRMAIDSGIGASSSLLQGKSC